MKEHTGNQLRGREGEIRANTLYIYGVLEFVQNFSRPSGPLDLPAKAMNNILMIREASQQIAFEWAHACITQYVYGCGAALTRPTLL